MAGVIGETEAFHYVPFDMYCFSEPCKCKIKQNYITNCVFFFVFNENCWIETLLQ